MGGGGWGKGRGVLTFSYSSIDASLCVRVYFKKLAMSFKFYAWRQSFGRGDFFFLWESARCTPVRGCHAGDIRRDHEPQLTSKIRQSNWNTYKMSRLTENALNYPKHLLSPQATIVHLQFLIKWWFNNIRYVHELWVFKSTEYLLQLFNIKVRLTSFSWNNCLMSFCTNECCSFVQSVWAVKSGKGEHTWMRDRCQQLRCWARLPSLPLW